MISDRKNGCFVGGNKRTVSIKMLGTNLSCNLDGKEKRDRGVYQRKDEANYASTLNIGPFNGTLEINFPSRSYLSNTIFLPSRIYLDRVLAIFLF